MDMGPDPAATSSLSSQLAGMSKCRVGALAKGTWWYFGHACSTGLPSCSTAGAGASAAERQPRPHLTRVLSCVLLQG